MSCCNRGTCRPTFDEGPPVVDFPVSSLEAKYLFMPYGTDFQVGDIVRIWLENGRTKTVTVQTKWPIEILPAGPEVLGNKFELPWQLIALDSQIEYEELMDWYHHPSHDPSAQVVVLEFKHPLVIVPSLKMRWMEWLYRIRNLGR
jgi:hypothetical protein